MELGLILNETGRSRQGETYLRQALDIRTRLLPNGHQLIGISEGALGECLTAQKRYTEAEPLLLRSYTVMKSSVGEQDPRTEEALGRLAKLYKAWAKPANAARYQPVPRQHISDDLQQPPAERIAN